MLWRQKEQFSDGVGYNWIDGLKAHADSMVSDEQLKQAPNRYVPVGGEQGARGLCKVCHGWGSNLCHQLQYQ